MKLRLVNARRPLEGELLALIARPPSSRPIVTVATSVLGDVAVFSIGEGARLRVRVPAAAVLCECATAGAGALFCLELLRTVFKLDDAAELEILESASSESSSS